MKILMITALMISGVFFIQSCTSASEKVKDEQTDVDEANDKLDAAKMDLEEDIAKYKGEQEIMIKENETRIAEYRQKLITDKKSTKETTAKIDELEMQNKSLTTKMNDYAGEGEQNWEKFKQEFNHDMENFGAAFKSLTSNDVR